ncbi:MAG: amidase family protein [Planctomycetota bacterium]
MIERSSNTSSSTQRRQVSLKNQQRLTDTGSRRNFIGSVAAATLFSSTAQFEASAAGNELSNSDLAFLPAVELARRIREKEISSEALTKYFISRIERYDSKLNSVVVRDFDRAIEASRNADMAIAKGYPLGPLHGLPITIKEMFDVAGMATSWGLMAQAGNIAEADSAVAERLRQAGAVFLGKTNIAFYGGDWQSFNPAYGTTNNPWDLTRTPGGSSGGSAAAVAAGFSALDFGSDIGGSIRIPAHFCGVFGHKPTHGIVPYRGHQPPGVNRVTTQVDLAVAGPIARSAEDLAITMRVSSGPDRLKTPGWRLALPKPKTRQLAKLRIAVLPDHPLAPVDSQIAERVNNIGELLSKLGAKVSDQAFPEFAFEDAHSIYLEILGAIEKRNKLEFYDWIIFNNKRNEFRTKWRRFFEDWDILICPPSSTVAFPHDQSEVTNRTLVVNGEQRPYSEGIFWPGIANLCYLPSTVFPTGLSSEGLPIGLQAIGPEFSDYTTIEFARLIAQELPVQTRPEVFLD